ncbi:MAG: hypothetical protein KGD63_06555 [Candidatus Lokiarchaeota archaeon]|nr:hypothetical protein [Candidatus Lokiarchaeota archaeon]
MSLDNYIQLFLEGKKNQMPITELYGRILRGKSPKDFETLTDDPERKIIMLMGGDGLEKLLGKSGREALITIGYMQDYIDYKVKTGFQFKLVVFDEANIAMLATWDNLITLISTIYPEVKDMIEKHLKKLKKTPFVKIEKKANRKFNEIDKEGPSHPHFMTHERFKNSKGTLVDVRAFLYHTIHLRELFAGDGFTYDENGQPGLKEYISPNCKLDELGEYHLIDMII